MTDNGPCYKSTLWRQALAAAEITHKRIAPTGPRPTARWNASTAPCSTSGPTPAPTNPKPSGAPPLTPGCIPTTITADNTALGGHPPASRITNLSGQNS
jgi:hypothetical protein